MKKGSNTSWYLYAKITVIPANWHGQATPVAPTQGQSGQRSFSCVCFGCEASFVGNGIIRWLKPSDNPKRLEWGVGWDVYKILSSTHTTPPVLCLTAITVFLSLVFFFFFLVIPWPLTWIAGLSLVWVQETNPLLPSQGQYLPLLSEQSETNA